MGKGQLLFPKSLSQEDLLPLCILPGVRLGSKALGCRASCPVEHFMNLGRGASAASSNGLSLHTASTELSGIKEAGAREEIHSLDMFTISFFCLISVG